AVVNDLLTLIDAFLSSHLSKKGSPTVIIVHRPTVERVVVALSTLESHPHENLGHVLRKLQGITLHLIEIRCGAGKTSPFRGNHINDDFIQRAVCRDLVSQPSIIKKGGFVGNAATE